MYAICSMFSKNTVNNILQFMVTFYNKIQFVQISYTGYNYNS